MGTVTTHAGTAGVVNAVAGLRPWVSSRAWSGPRGFGLAMAGPPGRGRCCGLVCASCWPGCARPSQCHDNSRQPDVAPASSLNPTTTEPLLVPSVSSCSCPRRRVIDSLVSLLLWLHTVAWCMVSVLLPPTAFHLDETSHPVPHDPLPLSRSARASLHIYHGLGWGWPSHVKASPACPHRHTSFTIACGP
jgi:hypothetical protein